MIISTIKQFGLRLRADPEEIPFQYSANVQMKFEKDENYNDYTVVGYYIPPGENEAKLLSINDDGTFILGLDCFKQRGTLSFSFNLINSIEEVHLGSIDFEVRYSFGDGDTILPEPEEVWISLVTQVAKDAIREEVALVKQKANEALQSASLANDKASEAEEYANNANQSAGSASLSASSALTAKNDAIAASNQALGFSNNASESAIEAKNSADEALENANASNKAIETVNQIKTQIEDKANEFDTNYQEKLKSFNDNATSKQNAFDNSVQTANTNLDNKVNQANSDLDAKVQEANTIIDEKVKTATEQAQKAKEEANRATQATDGKLDKNLGAENSDKVLITDVEGNIITQNKEDFEGGGTSDYNDLENKPSINSVELKGNVTSEKLGIIAKNDNFLYDDVAKQLNPNITDSFQRAMWNLKLYGQSTQGADPSPTNKQDITAISQFEGAPTGDNIFNPNSADTVAGLYKSFVVNPNEQQITISIEDNIANADITGCYLGTSKNGINAIDGLNWMVSSGSIGSRKYTTTWKYLTYYPNSEATLQKLLQRFNIKVEFGATATPYTPYQAQPFTYTPSQKMYSTQDGSICDYVDVEKGVEVYNTLEQTFNGTESGWQYQSATGIAFLTLENTPQQQPFCETMQCYKYVENQPYQDGLTINNLGILVIKIEGMTSLQDYKDYFSANPLKVRYGKSVVISTVPIPQEQLAMLRALYTYNGVTNFLCNAPVSFTYERSLQIVINNLENAIGQTNANILLNGGNN